jgi:Zn-dependent protease with chaperone function
MSEPVPPHEAWSARHFDGRTARPHLIGVRITPEGLALEGAESGATIWGWSELVLVRGERSGEPVQLECRRDPIESLEIPDRAFLGAIRAAWPPGSRLRRVGGAKVTLRVIALVAFVLVAGMVALARWGIPALASFGASNIPLDWERSLGRAVIADLAPESRRVSDPAIVRAVERVRVALVSAGPARSIEPAVIVVRLPLVNAFAAPGGTIVLTTELLRVLRGPDELAAVMAHEMAHVERRHPTRGILAQLSLGALLSIVAGDQSALSQGVAVAGELGSLSFSRADERDADEDACARLVRTGVSPRALAGALESLERGEAGGRGLSFLSTHPAPAERRQRIERFAASAKLASPRPILPVEDWTSLILALPPPAPR